MSEHGGKFVRCLQFGSGCQVVNLAVHVVLCLRQEAAICLARQGRSHAIARHYSKGTDFNCKTQKQSSLPCYCWEQQKHAMKEWICRHSALGQKEIFPIPEPELGLNFWKTLWGGLKTPNQPDSRQKKRSTRTWNEPPIVNDCQITKFDPFWYFGIGLPWEDMSTQKDAPILASPARENQSWSIQTGRWRTPWKARRPPHGLHRHRVPLRLVEQLDGDANAAGSHGVRGRREGCWRGSRQTFFRTSGPKPPTPQARGDHWGGVNGKKKIPKMERPSGGGVPTPPNLPPESPNLKKNICIKNQEHQWQWFHQKNLQRVYWL